MPPRYARGSAARQAAKAAARRWQRLGFDDLARAVKGTSVGTVTLPISSKATGDMPEVAAPSPSLTLSVSYNHPAFQARLAANLGPAWRPSETGSARAVPANPPLSSVASRGVTLHVGAPRKLGYPESVEMEKTNWAEAVLREEAYAYQRYDPTRGAAASSGSAPGPPVRWLTQPMLDGFVACRVDAHSGVTTGAMLEARETAKYFGKHVPPFDVSPYYGASELLDRWCLFGEAGQLVPQPQPDTVDDAHDHVARVLTLALGSSLLSGMKGAWLNGAVVVHKGTGDAVLILGPPTSGKTTLALHCLAASADLQLVAAEHFFLCDGTQLFPRAVAGGRALLASVPAQIGVGVGAILGTLLPNPLLTSHLVSTPPALSSPSGVEQLLRNTEGVIWGMAQKYPVDLASPDARASRWSPAVLADIRGVVLLDWETAELHARGPVRTNAAAARLSTDGGGWARQVDPLLEAWAAVRDHYLLRSIYSVADAPAVLSAAVAGTGAGTATVRLSGSVDFALGVKVVGKLLGA